MPIDVGNINVNIDSELSERVSELLNIIREIQELIEGMPSGIDYEVDPNNESPEDATAHTAGLIWKRCQEALGKSG